MKLILLSLLLISAVIAKPVVTPAPKQKLSSEIMNSISAEDIRKTEAHRNQLLQLQMEELNAEKVDQLKVGSALAEATSANLTLQGKVNDLTDKANSLQGNLEAANKKLW